MAEQLTVILNKLHALESIGFITLKEIAKRTGQTEEEVANWVMKRQPRLDGENAIRLFGFCSEITLIMSMVGKRRWANYRSAYERAKKLFPVEGNGK